jgi:glycosyltransferase involved in cell wall biosynthesis
VTLQASIILPSFNRRKILEKVLRSLELQSVAPDQYEVVISDDGSIDDTGIFLQQFSRTTRLNLKCVLSEKNSGPARARNLAIEKAVNEIIIIIGDDIELAPDFVAKHIHWHTAHPNMKQAVLGYVTWPDGLKTNAFMRWLEHGGDFFYFPYDDFRSGERIDCRHFYTCNLSLKRILLLQTSLFDESFPYASHEDIELGKRLDSIGMELYYDAGLKGYHWHHLDVNSIARRVYLMGCSAPIYWEKVNDHSGILKRCARKMLSLSASFNLCWSLLMRLMATPRIDDNHHPIRWKLILTLSYWIGFTDGEKNNPVKQFPDVGRE